MGTSVDYSQAVQLGNVMVSRVSKLGDLKGHRNRDLFISAAGDYPDLCSSSVGTTLPSNLRFIR